MIGFRSMLVMLAPTFDNSTEAYTRLSRVTGMLVYDLKSRLKPGDWGIVRVLADGAEANELALRLRSERFPAVVVDGDVAHDLERPMVTIRALTLEPGQLVIQLRERSMAVPYEALACVVRGEVQTGRWPSRHPSQNLSSSTFRAVLPGASDVQVFRESQPMDFDAFAAADLHFVTVTWAARIDARSFDFSSVGMAGESAAADLDRLVDIVGERAKVRVDRAVRSSSVTTFALQSSGPKHPSGVPPSAVRGRELPSDERFDPYSRLIAEGERELLRSRALSSRPAPTAAKR